MLRRTNFYRKPWPLRNELCQFHGYSAVDMDLLRVMLMVCDMAASLFLQPHPMQIGIIQHSGTTTWLLKNKPPDPNTSPFSELILLPSEN